MDKRRDIASGLRVLIVEDEWLIGEDLRERLVALGAIVLEPAPNCAAALEAIWNDAPDVAFVDTQLGGETCQVVVEECDRQGIPFVISTGHNLDDLPGYLMGRRVLNKPFIDSTLAASFAALQDAANARHL